MGTIAVLDQTRDSRYRSEVSYYSITTTPYSVTTTNPCHTRLFFGTKGLVGKFAVFKLYYLRSHLGFYLLLLGILITGTWF
jgi:hypothetical protein